MIKDCKTCIHQRVCQHKELNPKFKEEMRGLIKKWGNIYSEDCPEWHQKMITADKIYDNDPWDNKIDDTSKILKKKNNIFTAPKITYGDKTDIDKSKFKEIHMPSVKPCKEESKHTGYAEFRDGKITSLSHDCEDEIMATKEPEEDDLDVQIVYYEGQPLAKITHKKATKENKDAYNYDGGSTQQVLNAMDEYKKRVCKILNENIK